MRLCVDDSYKIGGVGTVACGRVETGKLTAGMKVRLFPSGLRTEVKSVCTLEDELLGK